MNEQTVETPCQPISRKAWRKPDPVILPIEDTATFASFGNDGSGSTTGS